MTFFECDQCDSSFISETALQMHVNMKHQLQHFESKTEAEIQCVMFEYKCKRTTNLNKHINTKHPNSIHSTPFKCKLCDWVSEDEQLIRYHMKDNFEKVRSAYQNDVNKMKEVTEKLSRIEESNKEFTENDNESVEKDESYDDNIMLNFNEDGHFIE